MSSTSDTPANAALHPGDLSSLSPKESTLPDAAKAGEEPVKDGEAPLSDSVPGPTVAAETVGSPIKETSDADEDESPLAKLTIEEQYWKDQYEWMLEAGYRLRSRYKPGWKASWLGTNKKPYLAEDGQAPLFTTINHAIQLDTNRFVTLKRLQDVDDDDSSSFRELTISQQLSTEPYSADKSNHAIQLIDILYHPTDKKTAFLVLPLLRDYDDPPFETVGEIVGFIQQFLEGVRFLHDQKIIHGDISVNNVMMDASKLYPDDFHPLDTDRTPDWSGPAIAKYSRTEKAPAYHLIDFGCSRQFEGDDSLPDGPGTDLTVPEYRDRSKPINGYFVDVYCVGNMLRHDFLDGDLRRPEITGYANLEFLRPLIDDMTSEDPAARPTMAEADDRFKKVVKALSSGTLRSRCVRKPEPGDLEDPPLVAFILSAHHWVKSLTYIARRLPPVPKPSKRG